MAKHSRFVGFGTVYYLNPSISLFRLVDIFSRYSERKRKKALKGEKDGHGFFTSNLTSAPAGTAACTTEDEVHGSVRAGRLHLS
ncbi:hypothetical protein RVIR1_06420 [Candidatus Rickettsiella viridis]|uniref:Uncharacterized protein n=2 Tax=Candidatus Rickettsiella viridis TaxID=676208 RepID=A0A2Z5UW61_9COXI|nr:hypothetical protein RVIR1_06420 [Candidatus Rickettsiella viridis]